MVVNNPLIRPYFLGGWALGGVPLDSHEERQQASFFLVFRLFESWESQSKKNPTKIT